MRILTRDEARKLIDKKHNINYVYALLDTDKKPFYIGKGTNGRIFTHLSSGCHNEKVCEKVKQIGKSNIKFLIYGFTSDYSHALRVESKLINRYDSLLNVSHNESAYNDEIHDQYLKIGESEKIGINSKTMMGSLTDLVKLQ